LFDYYLRAAAAAMNVLQPADRHYRFYTPASAIPTPAVADPSTAQRWLNTERANLAAIIAYTATTAGTPTPPNWPTPCSTATLAYFGAVHYPHALALYTHVQHAAHHTNDHTTEALR
jgi:hypothetical protein